MYSKMKKNEYFLRFQITFFEFFRHLGIFLNSNFDI